MSNKNPAAKVKKPLRVSAAKSSGASSSTKSGAGGQPAANAPHPAPAPAAPLSPAVSDAATEPQASPFVEDGGVVGITPYKFDGPPTPVDAEAAPGAAAAPEMARTPDPAPASEAAILTPSPAGFGFGGPPPLVFPSLAGPPAPEPVAQSMPNMGRSYEEMMMDNMSAGDDDEPTDPNPAGNISDGAADEMASSTSNLILNTFGLLANELVVDLTNVNVDEIESAIKDGELPAEVLADVVQLNKLNAKSPAFKKDYRDMIKPHLQRFCKVQGVENMSPTVLLLAVALVVLGMMYMDFRKRANERTRFMNRLLSKYGKPAVVEESNINRT